MENVCPLMNISCDAPVRFESPYFILCSNISSTCLERICLYRLMSSTETSVCSKNSTIHSFSNADHLVCLGLEGRGGCVSSGLISRGTCTNPAEIHCAVVKPVTYLQSFYLCADFVHWAVLYCVTDERSSNPSVLKHKTLQNLWWLTKTSDIFKHNPSAGLSCHPDKIK